MCLIVFSYKVNDTYPLIVAANRDEFYSRDAECARFWEDAPAVLAGRDLSAMGTWLGVNQSGAFAALTNFRAKSFAKFGAKSRGALVRDFLCQNIPAPDYLDEINKTSGEYNGFNLLAGNVFSLFYYCNQTGRAEKVSPGIHCLSNAFLDEPWPKVTLAKNLFGKITEKTVIDTDELFFLLADKTAFSDKDLPVTGVGLEWERLLSTIYIEGENYGTRCSTVIFFDKIGGVSFIERTYPERRDVSYTFKIKNG